MSTPTETELKLECDLSGLGALAAHPRLKSSKRRPAVKLRSVYFDTSDRKLHAAGVTLRVRTVRGRRLQTVKAQGDGLLARPEWECRVAGPEPDVAALADTPAAALLEGGEPLVPIFATEITRRIFLVREGETEIEAALDEGRIVAEGSAAARAVSELELELKSGSPADLFALARTLGEDVPLRLGVLGKSERGFALVEGATAGAVKAGPLALSKSMTAAEAFRAIAHHCLRQIRLNEAVLLDHRDVEALHQLRVGVRRLRSAVSLFGDFVRDDVGQAVIADLKRLSEPFGRARNLDVFVTDTLPLERGRRPDETGLLNLETQLEMDRTAAHGSLAEVLRSPEWRRVLLDLFAWINVGPWLDRADDEIAKRLDQPARKFAAAALDRRRRQVKKRGRKLDEISDEARHEVRIAAKKLRYGAQFFASLYDSEKKTVRRKAFVKALKALQASLGGLNDIATGHELLAEAASTSLKGHSSLFAAGLTAGDLDHDAGDLLSEARAAYEAFVDQRPFWR